MAEEVTTPPDLKASGGSEQPTGALERDATSAPPLGPMQGSQGLGGLLQALMQGGGQAPSMGEGLVGALAGGASLALGVPDPVAARRNQNLQQQVQVANLVKGIMQEQAQEAHWKAQEAQNLATQGRMDRNFDFQVKKYTEDRQYEQAKNAVSIYSKLRQDATDAPSRLSMAKLELDAMRKLMPDAQIPDSVAQGWATNKLSQEQQKALIGDLGAFAQDPKQVQIVADKWGIPQDEVANYYLPLSKNDAALESRGLPNQVKMQMERANLDKARAEAWIAQNPQFKDTGLLHGVQGYANEFSMRVYKTPLAELTDPAQRESALAAARAQASATSEKEAGIKFDQLKRDKEMEADLTLNRQKQLADYKSTLLEPKPLQPIVQQKLIAPLDNVKMNLGTWSTIWDSYQKMSKKSVNVLGVDLPLIPDRPGILPQWQSTAAQLALRGDTNLTNFRQFILEETIGQGARGLFDERNAKFKEAFQGQLEVLKNMPTKEGLLKFMSFYQKLIREKADSQMALIELQRNKDPEFVDEARSRYKALEPMMRFRVLRDLKTGALRPYEMGADNSIPPGYALEN